MPACTNASNFKRVCAGEHFVVYALQTRRDCIFSKCKEKENESCTSSTLQSQSSFRPPLLPNSCIVRCARGGRASIIARRSAKVGAGFGSSWATRSGFHLAKPISIPTPGDLFGGARVRALAKRPRNRGVDHGGRCL